MNEELRISIRLPTSVAGTPMTSAAARASYESRMSADSSEPPVAPMKKM